MLLKIITFIKGFVRVSVCGKFVERFLNICMNRNIRIWDIKKRGDELLHLNMTVEGFKRMPSVAYKSRTKVRIISKHGLPFIIKRHKKRKVFLISGITVAVLFVYITSFVWVVEVEGNEKVSEQRIISALEQAGFKKGSFRYGNDIPALQNKMLLEIDELSWVWVDIKGTRAVVEVKEKVAIPEIVDKNQPCNIVAEKDGLITQIDATYGQKAVKVGDVVKKGELLIGGLYQTRYDGLHYLHSAGRVTARTWYTKTADFALTKTFFSKTGNFFSKNTMNFLGFRVKLYIDKNPSYEYSEEDITIHRLSIGENLVIPISFEHQYCYELQKNQEQLSQDEALSDAVRVLYGELDSQISEDACVVNKTYQIIRSDENYITVKAEYECIEQIGIAVPIEIE